MEIAIIMNKVLAPTFHLQPDNSRLTIQSIQQKMASVSKQPVVFRQGENKTERTPLKQEDNMKIDKFINGLQQKDSDKEFFAYVFKTLIHLKKNEKEQFIAGVSQALRSLHDNGIPSLNERFTNALKRYMSISLMNGPISSQFNQNMNQFNIDGDDDDDIEVA